LTRLRTNKRFFEPACLCALLSGFIAVNARWIWLFRRGGLLDIDEAGYLGTSFGDYYAFVHGGVPGWIRAVWAPDIQAPLTTALSSVLYIFFGPHMLVGFAVPLLSGAATIAAVYFLGEALASRRVGLLCSVLAASCPIVVNFSRSYHFVMPATAAATLALLALVKSESFKRNGWAAQFGIVLGLMPLARTMTIAFLPGIVLGAVLNAAASPVDRERRLSRLAGALALALATAASWLAANGRFVFQYLVGAGYGARSAFEFGPKRSFFGWDAWLALARNLLGYIQLPHFLVLCAGGAAAVSIAVHGGLRDAVRSKVFPLFIFIATACAALVSSRNTGLAFIAPVVPAAIVLSVWALDRLGSGKIAASALTACAFAAATVAAAPLVDLGLPAARPRVVPMPVLGWATVADGRGTLQKYEAAGGFGNVDAVEPVGPELSAAWLRLIKETADLIVREGGAKPVAAFGFRHYLYNINSVSLRQLIDEGTQDQLVQVEPFASGQSAAGYREWLTRGDASGANLLLVLDGEKGQFLPAIKFEEMRAAARDAGFTLAQAWPMPDGQNVALWKRWDAAENGRGARTPPPRR
jgi:4-amino-4-deoxy-L-arabinose transferase-like glycosyltransferase